MQTSSEAKRQSSLTLKETIQDAPTLAQSCHLVSSCAGTHQFCSGPPIPQNPRGSAANSGWQIRINAVFHPEVAVEP